MINITILDDNWLWNNDGNVSSVDCFEWNTEVYIGRLPAEHTIQMVVVDPFFLYHFFHQFQKDYNIGS